MKKGWNEQRNIESLYEALFNVVFGGIINYFVTVIMLYFGLKLPLSASAEYGVYVTLVFSVISFARSYYVRRYNQWLLRNEKQPLGLRVCYWICDKAKCIVSKFRRVENGS